MPLPTQTADEEFTERVGETAPGVLVMPQLIAVDDYRKNQAAARRRVNEAHEMHKFALGFGELRQKKEGGEVNSDDMGDIIYTGDISLHPGQEVKLGRNTVIKADQPGQEPKPVNEQPQPAGKNWLPSLLLCESMLAGGSGLGYIVNDLLNPDQPAAASADTDTDSVIITDFRSSDVSEEKNKWKPGTIELATLRRADAEKQKAEESAKWRKFAREIFEWLKARFKTKE